MSSNKKFFNQIYSEIALITIMFLFFFELISDMVEAVYTLCLLTLSLNENVLTVLFLFSPIVLFFFRKGFPDKLMVIIGEIMIACRIIEPLLDTQLKMIFSGLGVGCFLIFFPVFLQKKNPSNHEKNSLKIGLGLSIALAASILFRTLGITVDISTYSVFQWIGWILALIAAVMILALLKIERNVNTRKINSDVKFGSPLKILGLTFGLMSILMLIYFAFSSPTVISRWTEGNYLAIIIILALVVASFAVILFFKPNIITKFKLWMILLWNGLFVLTLVLTIAINQVSFPPVEGIYPIDAPPTTIIQQIPLIFMLFLSPIILVDFTILSRELLKSKPSTWKLGGSFFITSVYLLLMIFAKIFTTVWDYIDVVGPFFRDMFWFVFLIVGIIVILPVLLVKESSLQFKISLNKIMSKITIAGIIGIITIGTIVGGILTESYPVEQPGAVSSIKVMTYNIQQAYDESGTWNFDGQLEVIRAEDPDIIGLQESDMTRLSGGNKDEVRYFANKLNIYSYFGPTVVVGTFGYALLSKYPIDNPTTFYVYSISEQIACIQAEITIGATVFNVFVTHPAGPNRYIHLNQMLSRIEGKSNVIFMGDFNFDPSEQAYNITTAILDDCWEVADSSTIGTVPQSWVIRLPAERIDHIFVSPGTIVTTCRYFGGTNSDHPACVAEIQL